MNLFYDLDIPCWEILFGNLLVLITSGFYIAWWSVCYRPNRKGNATGAGPLLIATILTGLTAILVMSLGIYSLTRYGDGFSVRYILLGATAVFIILLAVTKLALKRPVTSELLLIIAFCALESSAIAALEGDGRLGMELTVTLAAVVALATLGGLVCYVLYFRLSKTARFWYGLIPLIADAGVAAVFVAVLAVA
jgi:hypothetical protein